ncbi:TadE/TadG family type IV pilus assembly protein [Actinomycetaceae bacterium L2_0104]
MSPSSRARIRRWSRERGPRPVSDERGQTLVGFALVAPLLLIVALALIGMAMALHARVIILDSAAEGARAGSSLNSGLEAAESRTRELIVASLPEEYGRDVRAGYRNVAGVAVVEVVVTSPVPILGVSGPATMEVRAHAAIE